MLAATALRQAPKATPELAALAVEGALEKAGLDFAGEVLLFLTPEFARDPQPAILAAARAASCTRVAGCTAVGIFNEDAWVVDAPAAVAMVFDHNIATVARDPTPDSWRLTLMTPEALAKAWLRAPGRCYGAIGSAASGRGPFATWSASRVHATGHDEISLPGAAVTLHVAPGIHPLTELLRVSAADGFELARCNDRPAWPTLLRALPRNLLQRDSPPWQNALACLADEAPLQALAAGRYEIVPVLNCDPTTNVVTLTRRVMPGASLFWALRDPDSAAAEWTSLLANDDASSAAYGLLFSCVSRGAGFYGGHDRDWDAVRARFPQLPFAGLYGNGEIAWRAGANRLLQYSAVLALIGEEA
jgi:small ligand-binding sensory domain FIST